jgi:hypothetical protein
MAGSINDILPEPVSGEAEAIIEEHIKLKMRGAASLAVALLRAMEDEFGLQARDVVRRMAERRYYEPIREPGDPAEDLAEFCDRLDRGCVGSHRWERVLDEPDCVGYEFTRCMWAEVFCELGEPELGYVICAGDEPMLKSYNPRLGFRRTKVLMEGDAVCDHLFYVEDRTNEGT